MSLISHVTISHAPSAMSLSSHVHISHVPDQSRPHLSASPCCVHASRYAPYTCVCVCVRVCACVCACVHACMCVVSAPLPHPSSLFPSPSLSRRTQVPRPPPTLSDTPVAPHSYPRSPASYPALSITPARHHHPHLSSATPPLNHTNTSLASAASTAREAALLSPLARIFYFLTRQPTLCFNPPYFNPPAHTLHTVAGTARSVWARMKKPPAHTLHTTSPLPPDHPLPFPFPTTLRHTFAPLPNAPSGPAPLGDPRRRCAGRSISLQVSPNSDGTYPLHASRLAHPMGARACACGLGLQTPPSPG